MSHHSLKLHVINMFYTFPRSTATEKVDRLVYLSVLSCISSAFCIWSSMVCGVCNHVQLSISVSFEVQCLLGTELLLFHRSLSPQLVLWGTGFNYFPSVVNRVMLGVIARYHFQGSFSMWDLSLAVFLWVSLPPDSIQTNMHSHIHT